MEPIRKATSGRRYDEGFKENAVSLLESGRSFKEVARDLGVSNGQLRVWFKRQQRGQSLNQRKTFTEPIVEGRSYRMKDQIETP
jgi:transposase-like protein